MREGDWPLQASFKDFNLEIEGGIGWMQWLKHEAGKGLIFHVIDYSSTISLLTKILLVKLKYLYTQYAWISIMKKENSNQNMKVEKMMVYVKTLDRYHHKFNFGNFFSCPVKL